MDNYEKDKRMLEKLEEVALTKIKMITISIMISNIKKNS